MMISLTWGAVIKIALLIVIFHAVKEPIKKLQEKYCPLCKTDSCCK